MKTSLAAPRFEFVVICVLVLIGVAAFAQGEGEKTLNDAIAIFDQAMAAEGENRLQDAILWYEEAVVIVRDLGEHYAEGVILNEVNPRLSEALRNWSWR